MIKELLRGSKQHFLDKFQKSSYLPVIQKFKDGKLVLAVMTEEDFYKQKQRTTFHMILSEVWKSGMHPMAEDNHPSKEDYNRIRDYYKKKIDFITPESAIVENGIVKITINNKSLSDATKEDYMLIIREIINDVDDLGISSKKLDEARIMWQESNSR